MRNRPRSRSASEICFFSMSLAKKAWVRSWASSGERPCRRGRSVPRGCSLPESAGHRTAVPTRPRRECSQIPMRLETQNLRVARRPTGQRRSAPCNASRHCPERPVKGTHRIDSRTGPCPSWTMNSTQLILPKLFQAVTKSLVKQAPGTAVAFHHLSPQGRRWFAQFLLEAGRDNET